MINVKAYKKAIVTILMLMIFASTNAYAQCVASEGGTQTQTLYAGQTIDIGTVSVEVIADDLVVTYSTNGDWQLTETHLWVGTDTADMPQTRKGSPKIGNFPYASGDVTGSTIHSESIALSALGFSCPSDDSIYYVAAHAAVARVSSTGEVLQSETAWADGDRFVEKGMWGTYFTTTLTCDCDTVSGPGPNGSCETAFAYSGSLDGISNGNTNAIDADITNSFLDLDEDGDLVGDFNRWGWSNGDVGEGIYYWDIYAGAGQSDVTKGTLVGTLTVDYGAGTAIVDFDMVSPYYMEETHLYVGNEILPLDKNGDLTVAPGQYPTIHDSDVLNNAMTDSYTIDGLSGTVYVVAHAVVCGFSD